MYYPATPTQEGKHNATFSQEPVHDESHNLTHDDPTRAATIGGGSVSLASETFDPYKLTADLASVLAPLALLGFLIAVYMLDKHEVDQQSLGAWRNAITVLATLFPIVFASIVGRLMNEAARWRLESGSTMGVLEQLLGSRTVGTTITTHVYLRAFNLLGLGLLLAWALSPLGSQSILRILETRLAPRVVTVDLSYYDNLQGTGFAILPPAETNGEAVDAYFQYLTALYGATLLAPTSVKNSSMDQWGNVKIPFLDYSRTDSDWRDVQRTPSLEWYSSLAGIPVMNVPYGNTTISIESTYLDVVCSNVTEQPLFGGEMVWWDWPVPVIEFEDRDFIPPNGTWQGGPQPDASGNIAPRNVTVWRLGLNNFVDYYWINSTAQVERNLKNSSQPFTNTARTFVEEHDIEVHPTSLVLQITRLDDRENPGDEIEAHCGVRQRYVESLVSCERISVDSSTSNCTVVSQRPSQKQHPNELISDLNFPWVWGWIADRLPLAASWGQSRRPDMTLQYLHSPEMSLMSPDDSHHMFRKA